MSTPSQKGKADKTPNGDNSGIQKRFKVPKYLWFATGTFNIFNQEGICHFRQSLKINLQVMKGNHIEGNDDLQQMMEGSDWLHDKGHFFYTKSFYRNDSTSEMTIRLSTNDKDKKKNSRKNEPRPAIRIQHVPPAKIKIRPDQIIPKAGLPHPPPVRHNPSGSQRQSVSASDIKSNSSKRKKDRKPSISNSGSSILPSIEKEDKMTSSTESQKLHSFEMTEDTIYEMDRLLIKEFESVAGPYPFHKKTKELNHKIRSYLRQVFLLMSKA